jgi:hypothetical protein
MKSTIESLAHWMSISCMAGAISMVCAGHMVLEPALQTGGEWVSLLYWSVCAAFVISTTTFAYVALASAQLRLRAMAAGNRHLPSPATAVESRPPTAHHAAV